MNNCNSNSCFKLQHLRQIAKQIGMHERAYKHVNAKNLSKMIGKKIASINDGPEFGEPLFTRHVLKIMKKIQKMYPRFEFLGVFPIDIESSYRSIMDMNYSELARDHKQLGIVWNTDIAGGPGKHWIAIFIDFASKNVCYFDSLLQDVPREIKSLLKYMRNEGFSVNMNKKKFQETGTNCGVFVIYFMISRLEGQSCIDFLSDTTHTTDELMTLLRRIIFPNKH